MKLALISWNYISYTHISTNLYEMEQLRGKNTIFRLSYELCVRSLLYIVK